MAVDSDEMSLKDVVLKLKEWFRYIWSNALIIFLLFLIGAGIGFAYAWYKKPMYVAISTFVLEDGEKGGGLGQYAGLASMVGIDMGGGGGGLFQGDNIIELYKSRTMIQKSLLSEVEFNGKRQLLIDRYLIVNNIKDKAGSGERLLLKDINFALKPGETFSRKQDSILGVVTENINKEHLMVSKPDKKLSIIQVNVKSEDEFFAKAFNDLIVRNVNDFYIETKTKKSQQNVVILQQKTDSVRAVLNMAVNNAAYAIDATPNLNPTRQAQRVVPLQRAQFSAETNKEVLSELLKTLELSKISLRKETPLIQAIDQPIFPLEVQKTSKVIAALVGGIIAGFLALVFLIFKRLFSFL